MAAITTRPDVDTTAVLTRFFAKELDTVSDITDTAYLVRFGTRMAAYIADEVFAAGGLQNVACLVLEAYRARYKELVGASAPATAEAKPYVPVAIQAEAAESQASLPAVADATYTVIFAAERYVTVRIKTAGEGSKFEGKRIASFLSGPDNESDFQGFAFVNEDGTVAVWKRFRSVGYQPFIDALNVVLGNPARSDEFREAYAKVSGKCARCGRKLTVPASLNRGLGPECAKLM